MDINRIDKLHKRKKKRKRWVVLFVVLLFLLGGAGIMAAEFWSSIYETREPIDEDLKNAIENKKNELDPDSLLLKDRKKGNGPFTVLLLGVDTYDAEQGRTDTMMVAIVDPKDNEVSLVSIPRDMRVEIIGRGEYGKINSAYAWGGINMSIATVEHFLEIPIDYYATVDFKGFQALVDAIGGIELNVEKSMTFWDRLTKQNVSFQAGPQTLNGFEALNYARFRGDAEGDFGRNRRQQQVVSAILDQTIDLRNVTNLTEISEALGDNVRTDISFTKMVSLAGSLKMSGDEVESIKYDAYPTNIGGASYVTIDDAELERLKGILEEKMKN
ncbi:LytR family transcriptional attenuator [Bacillus oleivorans]|uniref:LytR family transcriptional attenuator n=1 Tax=Bacillus oleivorans TaxID=1448271 RepID=A0A285CI64_9BACI|nr:LCP family protein [Bacillus oleivorans]SNX67291.1 LytR family transcriptional attenuator [Bacillus oleivorans]